MYIAEALEMRDVLSDSGDTLDMRHKRATDMRGEQDYHDARPEQASSGSRVHYENGCVGQDVCQLHVSQLQQTWCAEGLQPVEEPDDWPQDTEQESCQTQGNCFGGIKGKKFVLVDEQTYTEMAKDHMAGDVPVSNEEIRENQKTLSSTAKSLANIFSLGMSHSMKNYPWCFDNCSSQAEDIPNLKVLPKVHKPPGPKGHLQSHPVVTAAFGLSSCAGDQLADFLEPLIAVQSPRLEDLSTEEVLRQLEEAQDAIKDARRTDTCIGSLDVKALYPSLDQEGSVRAAANFVLHS